MRNVKMLHTYFLIVAVLTLSPSVAHFKYYNAPHLLIENGKLLLQMVMGIVLILFENIYFANKEKYFLL